MGGGEPHSKSELSSDLPDSTLQQNRSHSHTLSPPPPINDLSDVFSSDSPPPPSEPLHDSHSDLPPPPRSSQPQLSDIPRLRQQHSTAGYRDGISAAKPAFIQAGFDVGYFLGGFIGARVGWLVGVLLGIRRAVERGWEEKARKMGWDVERRTGEEGDDGGGGRWRKEIDRVRTWEREARGELTMGNVIGEKYWDWAAEGKGEVWRFELRGEKVEEVDWREVVESHPLVVKWAARVGELVKVWAVDLGVLEEGEEHDGEVKSGIVDEALAAG